MRGFEQQKNVCPFKTLTTLNLYSHMFRENQVRACEAVANALKFNEPPEPTPPPAMVQNTTADNCTEEKIGRSRLIQVKTRQGA